MKSTNKQLRCLSGIAGIGLLTLSSVLTLSSCDPMPRYSGFHDSNKWGKVISEEIQISPFNRIIINTSTDVIFTQSDTLKAVVEGNELAISEYSFTVEGESDDENQQLVIDNARRLNYNIPGIRLRISAPDLNKVTIYGSGDFDIKDSVELDNLYLMVAGSGDISIRSLKCKDARIDVKGSGDVSIRKIKCHNLSTTIYGSGDIDIRKATCKQRADLYTYGSGDIDAGIKAKVIKAVSQGSGDIELDVDCEELTINSQGAGDIEIAGRTKLLTKSSTKLGTTNTKKLSAEQVKTENNK